MSRRKIAEGTRFRVLQRDKFRCRYCGAHGSETELHIDHVHPVSAGGSNSPLNLVTSCKACNLGKHARAPEWEPCWQLEPEGVYNQFENLDLEAWDLAREALGPVEDPDLAMVRYRNKSREWVRVWGFDGQGREQCDPVGTMLDGAFNKRCVGSAETCDELRG